jgi:hypothetical protein
MNRPARKDNMSGIKGVSFSTERQKWVAQIGHQKRVIPLGRFNTKEEAAEAYRIAAEDLHGEYARLA